MDLCNESCSFVACQKLSRWTLHVNGSATFLSYLACLQAPLTPTFLYHFTDLDLAGGSRVQHTAKPVCFIFSHTFHMVRIKIDVVMEHFKAFSWTSWPSMQYGNTNMLFVGSLASQQHASVSQGRICYDNLTYCHTEIEAADQSFYLIQSQYTDTGPTSPHR